MKNYSSILGVFLCLWMIPQFSSGQELETSSYESNQEMYDFYMSKNRKLKKTGLILFLGGVATTVTSAIILSNTNDFDDGQAPLLFFTAGVLSTTASIPILIIAGSNKKKAEAMIQAGRHQMMDMTLSSSQYVSLGIRFDL